jgi:Fe-S cluster biogenesis protein NfuA
MTDTNEENKKGGDREVVSKIKDVLDQHIRPMVARDGGDVVFDSYEDGVVYVSLRGRCAGCPGATATLKMGVEGLLKRVIPEVREVRQVR